MVGCIHGCFSRVTSRFTSCQPFHKGLVQNARHAGKSSGPLDGVGYCGGVCQPRRARAEVHSLAAHTVTSGTFKFGGCHLSHLDYPNLVAVTLRTLINIGPVPLLPVLSRFSPSGSSSNVAPSTADTIRHSPNFKPLSKRPSTAFRRPTLKA